MRCFRQHSFNTAALLNPLLLRKPYKAMFQLGNECMANTSLCSLHLR